MMTNISSYGSSSSPAVVDTFVVGREERRAWPGPVESTALNRLKQSMEKSRAALELFLLSLPPEAQRPMHCQGQGLCDGYVYEWRGPLEWKPDAYGAGGWVRQICPNQECQAAELRRLEEEDAAIRAARLEKLERFSGLPLVGKFKDVSLASFEQTANGQQRWYSQMANWVHSMWPGCTTGMVLYGNYGVGKTGLVIAAAKELALQHGISVYFTDLADFRERVGQAWAKKDGSEYELLKKMREVDLLILDDWGAGTRNVKDFDESSPLGLLFNVLNKRYTAEKPFVITSNADSKAAFQQIVGERLMNRIFDSCQFVKCAGENLRKGPRLRVVDPWESQEGAV